MTAITLNLEPIAQLTHEQFYELCMANRDVPMERSLTGELIIMTPLGGLSGNREADYISEVLNYPATLSGENVLPGFELMMS
jgi:Uma2 family endonuclease